MRRVRGFMGHDGRRLWLGLRVSLRLERFPDTPLPFIEMRIDTGSPETIVMPQDWGGGLIPVTEWVSLAPVGVLQGVGGTREYAIEKGVLSLADEDGKPWLWEQRDIKLVLLGDNDLVMPNIPSVLGMDIIGLGAFTYRSDPVQVLLELP